MEDFWRGEGERGSQFVQWHLRVDSLCLGGLAVGASVEEAALPAKLVDQRVVPRGASELSAAGLV